MANRRQFISGIATASTVVISGCGGSSDNEEEGGENGGSEDENQGTRYEIDSSNVVYDNSFNQSNNFQFDAKIDNLIEVIFVNDGQSTVEIEVYSPEEENIINEAVEQTPEFGEVEEIFHITAPTSGTYSGRVTVPERGFAALQIRVEN